MKGNHPIRVNRERETNQSGGRWSLIDPVSQGRVRILSVKDRYHQAVNVKAELDRIKGLSPGLKWEECAILSRTKDVLAPVRSVFEQAGYPIKTTLDRSLPLRRVRETALFIKLLREKENENCRASELLGLLSKLVCSEKKNMWCQMLEDFLKNYQDETADATLPVRWTIDRLYEFIAEQRRDKVLGRGIFLSTIHSAKGMEFSHVFIMDGDWGVSQNITRREEERRILYVGMARAKETLILMNLLGRPNPYLRELKGDSVLVRSASMSLEKYDHTLFQKYEFLGLNDIFMDYSGGFPQNHPIHERLAKLEVGHEVSLCSVDSRVEIQDREGYCVGRLSSGGAKRLKEKLDTVSKVKVIALLKRYHNDPEENFTNRIKTDEWELPLLEVEIL